MCVFELSDSEQLQKRSSNGDIIERFRLGNCKHKLWLFLLLVWYYCIDRTTFETFWRNWRRILNSAAAIRCPQWCSVNCLGVLLPSCTEERHHRENSSMKSKELRLDIEKMEKRKGRRENGRSKGQHFLRRSNLCVHRSHLPS